MNAKLGTPGVTLVNSSWQKATRLDRGVPVWVNLDQVAALDWLVGQGKDHTRITLANGSFLTVLERPEVLLVTEMPLASAAA